MTTLRVTMIDDKPAVFLPDDLAARLGVIEGSEIVFEDGVLRPTDDVIESQVATFKAVMERRRDVLRRLAE
ncbi:hypothetical protein Pla108_16820 [Botrimarina colliarenosi]|uniref:SpoVT-AbrB domain-containing protein n=1 Tax=Botrimarina colliarenosi TaxID=2528001 RepID=A0A5C6AM48_9BACT|nr:hypothetical protein [Botrimarina colliarenosi]TWU00730.1 hypothetical protein Pla108_16820 [Botrimarina colliarenosi]